MTSIERFDITVGPFTFQARQAGPADGRPVILLHGVPESSACWNLQLPVLAAAGYRAVAFTQRGFSPGARIDDVEAFTIDKLVGDVLGVADELGFDRFDVVGHDAGAGPAWTLGAYHPDRIVSLTAVSVPHPAAWAGAYYNGKDGDNSKDGDGGDDQHARSGYMRQIAKAPRGTIESMFAAGDGQMLKGMLDAGLPKENVEEYIELVGTPEGARGLLDWYRAGSVKDQPIKMFSESFPDIEVPTLYVWSDQDPVLGPTAAYATENHIKGAYTFVVLEGVGHWIQELAADPFNEALLSHLAAHPA